MFASLLSGMEIAVMSEVKIGAQASLLALSAGREQPFANMVLSIKQAVAVFQRHSKHGCLRSSQ